MYKQTWNALYKGVAKLSLARVGKRRGTLSGIYFLKRTPGLGLLAAVTQDRGRGFTAGHRMPGRPLKTVLQLSCPYK